MIRIKKTTRKGLAGFVGLAIFLNFWMILPGWFEAELSGLIGRATHQISISLPVFNVLSNGSDVSHALRTAPISSWYQEIEESEEYNPILLLPESQGIEVSIQRLALQPLAQLVEEPHFDYLVLRRTGSS